MPVARRRRAPCRFRNSLRTAAHCRSRCARRRRADAGGETDRAVGPCRERRPSAARPDCSSHRCRLPPGSRSRRRRPVRGRRALPPANAVDPASLHAPRRHVPGSQPPAKTANKLTVLAFYGTFNRRCQQRSRSGTTRVPVTAGAAMSSNTVREFSRYLVEQNFVTADVTSKLRFSEARGTERKLRDLWELTELSAGDFADEV